MSSLMNAIRAAVLPGSTADALLSEIESETGAGALSTETPLEAANPTGGPMAVQQSKPGAAPAAAGAVAAVVAAASGGDDGYAAAMNRINAIVSADGIKGDAGRMNAALDLANASPGMTADAIIAFVSTNVPTAHADAGATTVAGADAATSYEHQRVAAANLAAPGGASVATKASPKIDRDAIFAARRNQTKGE